MSEPHEEHHAEHIVHHAERRALGSRPRLRLLAVVVWSAFLGACALLLAWLAFTTDATGPLSLGRLTRIFLTLWALALVPAASAALLGDARPGRRHGPLP